MWAGARFWVLSKVMGKVKGKGKARPRLDLCLEIKLQQRAMASGHTNHHHGVLASFLIAQNAVQVIGLTADHASLTGTANTFFATGDHIDVVQPEGLKQRHLWGDFKGLVRALEHHGVGGFGFKACLSLWGFEAFNVGVLKFQMVACREKRVEHGFGAAGVKLTLVAGQGAVFDSFLNQVL